MNQCDKDKFPGPELKALAATFDEADKRHGRLTKELLQAKRDRSAAREALLAAVTRLEEDFD